MGQQIFTKKLFIGLLSLSIGTIVIGCVFLKFFLEKFPNHEICLTIKPGISKDEISRKMKVSHYRGDWIFFETNPFAAGPIKARMNKNHSKIQELNCMGESRSEWKLLE